MKISRRLVPALLLAACITAPGMARAQAVVPRVAGVAPMTTPATPEYRIGPNDELSVVLPYNPELNHDGPVGPDGRFTMPLAGALDLDGLTTSEAEQRIAAAYRRGGIVADPRPSVTVRRYGAVVYVGGEVRTPGAVTLVNQMDPLQAVIVAGGMLDTARAKKIVIIRRDAEGKATTRVVNLRAYAHHGVTPGTMALLPRDVVFVPKSAIAEADVWVDQYINKLIPFNKGVNYNIGQNSVSTVIP